MLTQEQERFAAEVEKLKKVAQDNDTIQEEVATNISQVQDELNQVEVLMKGMKNDILQYRYALDGMKDYGKELDTINQYCTAIARNSKNIERGSLLRNHTAFLNALSDIYKSFEFISNHPNIKERDRLIEMQSNIIRRLVDECTVVLSNLLKGEKINYIPYEDNTINQDEKLVLLETYFGISPSNLEILKNISVTLQKCGKYGFMNDCRTFMTMFLKRIIRSIIEDTKAKHLHKPDVEIMSYVYDKIIKYLEIELILTKELFGEENTQFVRIMDDALTLFVAQWKESLTAIQELMNSPVTEETDITTYISDLCATVNSCAIFVSFIGKNESRYQYLFKLQTGNHTLTTWNSLIQEVQQDCSQLMMLILEMTNRDHDGMNAEASVSIVTSSIINYLRSINRYADKLDSLALSTFVSAYPVIASDHTLSSYERYTASLLMALREYLVRSTATTYDMMKSHLYLANNFNYISEGVTSGLISVGSFIPNFMKRLFTEEYNAYMQLSWLRLLELSKDRINPPLINGKAIQSEHRKYIKNIFAQWNSIYEEIVPAQFYMDVPSASIREGIFKIVREMVAEYKVMWEQYIALPFSLHHRKRYLLHPPEIVEYEVQSLFTRPV